MACVQKRVQKLVLKMLINKWNLERNIISEYPSFETPIKMHVVCKIESSIKQTITKK